MQCPSCGYENVSGAERCASCGRPLPQTVGQGYSLQSSGEPPSMPPSGPYQSPTPYGETPGQPNVPPQQPASQPPSYGTPPPPPGYGTPPPGYGAPTPQSGYGTPPPGYGAPTPQSGYGTPPPPPGYGAPTPQPGYGAPTPQPGYDAPAPTPQPGYGTPTTPPGYGTTPPPPPGYGTPPPPQQPGAPYAGYGQPAPPSYPMQPGQPGQPGWQYPPGYAAGGQPPQPPQRRNRTGCIVGAIIAVVVVLVACSVGGFVLLNQANSITSTIGLPTTTTGASVTATPSKTIVYQNDFSSQADNWPSDANCSLGSDGYHITDGFICYAPPDDQTDIDVTVSVKQISGSTTNGHGIVIRRTSQGNLYDFDIYADNGWVFAKCVNSDCTKLTGEDTNSAIKSGLNAVNTLEVVATGSHFDLFANGTKIGQTDDTTFASGLVGLDSGDSTECVFTDFTMAKPA